MAGWLPFFDSKSMDEYIAEAREREGALIIDVREPPEYASGHVEGALNVPGRDIARLQETVPDRQTHLYVYCRSGIRSKAAVRTLHKMGYGHAVNIGGVMRYGGTLVEGE